MKNLLTNIFVIAVLAGIGVAVGCSIAFTRPVEAAAPQIVTKEVPVLVTTPDPIAPVLARIAQCESHGKQFVNGQVLIHINHDGTYDQGIMQINSIHNAEAAKLGFNLATEDGNMDYAKYLYMNYGTGDWQSSSSCWRR